MDRRIKRTRAAVFNAIFDLMVEKDAKKITVLELCKRADINKSTFYLHYKSMDDCLQKCFEAIMSGITDLSKNINYEEIKYNPEPVVNQILDEIEQNIDYIYRFKSSSICGPSIKVLKENLVTSISARNGFTIEENYFEVATITFAVAGCIDALIEPLPVFKKDKLSKAICAMLRASRNPSE